MATQPPLQGVDRIPPTGWLTVNQDFYPDKG